MTMCVLTLADLRFTRPGSHVPHSLVRQGHEDYALNTNDDSSDQAMDIDTDANGTHRAPIPEQSGLASDDSESEDEDGIDPQLVAESAGKAGHLDGLSDTLKKWMPFLISLDQQKQTICLKLINEMLESPLEVTNSQQLHSILMKRIPYKTKPISKFENRQGKVEQQVLVYWEDTKGLLQAVVDDVQRIGNVVDFSAKELHGRGGRQYSESQNCDRMVDREQKLRDMEASPLGGRQNGEAPWALLPIAVASDKTMTTKRGINVYPVRILSPLIGTANIARRDASILWAMLPILSKANKDLFVGMPGYLRAPACWWVLKKAFEVLLDPLREYSKNGVLLKCFDNRGQRIERRFFPFVLYSVSDIEEDWMHGCITGIFTQPEYRPDPRSLAKVSDMDSIIGEAASAVYEPRSEYATCQLVSRLRSTFTASYRQLSFDEALDTVKPIAKELSLSTNVVISPEVINDVLGKIPSARCRFIEWAGKEITAQGGYTYARALTFGGFSSRLGVDASQVSSPDWLHCGIEGIGKQILGEWLPSLTSNNQTISTMNKVIALASWFPHTYRAKTNLPRRGFSALSDPAMLWGVHRVGLLQVSRIAFLVDDDLRIMVPLVRDLMKLNQAVKSRRYSDDTVSDLQQLIQSFLDNYHKVHHKVKGEDPIRRLKPFLLLSYHRSIKAGVGRHSRVNVHHHFPDSLELCDSLARRLDRWSSATLPTGRPTTRR